MNNSLVYMYTELLQCVWRNNWAVSSNVWRSNWFSDWSNSILSIFPVWARKWSLWSWPKLWCSISSSVPVLSNGIGHRSYRFCSTLWRSYVHHCSYHSCTTRLVNFFFLLFFHASSSLLLFFF